ncbi:hypothetical protein CRYUN_Cryun08bG0055800 [Craigia yunnanensis]
MSNSKTGEPIHVVDHFQYVMFCLLVLMCFGDKLNQEQIKEIEDVQCRLLLDVGERFNILNFLPNLTRVLLRKYWKEFFQVIEKSRKKLKEERLSKTKEDKGEADYVLAYVDTLLDVQLLEEKRNLTEHEIVNLSSEFLNAGTNMVKYPHV